MTSSSNTPSFCSSTSREPSFARIRQTAPGTEGPSPLRESSDMTSTCFRGTSGRVQRPRALFPPHQRLLRLERKQSVTSRLALEHRSRPPLAIPQKERRRRYANVGVVVSEQ